jgi:Fe2+ transport protein
MNNSTRPLRAIRRAGAVLAAAALVAGCAAADKNATSASSGSSGSSSASSSMPGMDMGSGSTEVAAVNGIKPIPSQLLATTTWQGMRIEARTMTAVPFVIFNGSSEQMVKPPKGTNFHLMVMLNDAHTNEPIPYASVWATFAKNGKVIYDERQWPMLSAFMGPHYGNNVQLAGAGKYKLTLLITPPVSARHLEYQHVWLEPHRVTVAFNWKPPST